MRALRRATTQAGTIWLAVVVDAAALVVAALLTLRPLEPVALVMAVLAALLMGTVMGLHRPRLVLSVLDDLPALAGAALVAGLVVAAASPGIGVDVEHLLHVATFSAAAFAVSVAARTVGFALVRALRLGGWFARPTLVVGSGPMGRRLSETLLLRGDLGLRAVGMIDNGPRSGLRDLPLPLVGDVDDLEQAMRDLGVADLIVAVPGMPDAAAVQAVGRALRAGHRVYVVPRFHELLDDDADPRTELLRDLALTRLRPPRRRPARVVDVLVAGAALVVLSPVLAIIALAVRLETGAVPWVHQARALPDGAGQRWVFRTLRPADLGPDDATSWHLDAERRIGPVGRFLRRTGLDELLRLVDVVVGVRRSPPEPTVRPDEGPADDPADDSTSDGWAWSAAASVPRRGAVEEPSEPTGSASGPSGAAGREAGSAPVADTAEEAGADDPEPGPGVVQQQSQLPPQRRTATSLR